jgi:hypothetical protein
MNLAHVHLLVNHIPVLGVALGLVVLAAAAVRHHTVVVRCALVLFVISALAAIPTYLTGEPAEDLVESAAGDVEAWVEPHEEAALVSLVLVEGLGVLSIIGLWMSRDRPSLPRGGIALVLVLAAITAGSLTWTANLGGQIRHSEIRGGPPSFQR